MDFVALIEQASDPVKAAMAVCLPWKGISVWRKRDSSKTVTPLNLH